MESPPNIGRDFPTARTRDGIREGFIIPIGGAEEKIGDTRILSRFVKLCGGDNARIAIIPTASQLDDTGSRYEEIFQHIGVRSAEALPFKVRDDCEREDWLETLEQADGIFMKGWARWAIVRGIHGHGHEPEAGHRSPSSHSSGEWVRRGYPLPA